MKNKILVMEDDASIRILLGAILKKAGYHVHACVNGKEGIEAFRTGQFDLVITDMDMPLISGLEAIKLIRQESPTVPIIAMSGAGRSKAFSNMADYYTADVTILKPFDAKQILAAVKKTIAG